MFDSLLVQFVILWAVIDPIGSVPVFLAKTNGLSPKICRRIARNAIFISIGVLLFFLILGQILLEKMQISLSSFQIAGGLVLLIFSLSMIFGESKPEKEIRLTNQWEEIAVYPLAIPSIASPGAMMTVVLLTDNHRFHLPEQIMTAVLVLVILIITYILFLLAGYIHKFIGNVGASIISRIMGLILSAVAVDNILTGLSKFIVEAIQGSVLS